MISQKNKKQKTNKQTNKQEVCEKLIEMSRNKLYSRKFVWFFISLKLCHELIGIDWSRQTNASIPQQINFTKKIEDDDSAPMLFIAEKQQKTILNFSLNSLTITE